MGIEQIITKIVEEARTETTSIRAEYDEKVKILKGGWDEEKKLKLETLEKELETIKTREMDRQVIAEKLEARKRTLALKHTIVNEAFESAQKDFEKISKEKYLPIIANIVSESVLTGDEAVILNKVDSKNIGKDLIKKANELINKRGLEGALTLGKPSDTLEGGVILKGESVEIRQTISELVQEVRMEVEGRVLKALFEE